MDLILIILILILLFGGGFGYHRWGYGGGIGIGGILLIILVHLFVARARGIVIFRNYVADTPDRVVSAEPGYSSGRVRSAMVDGGRGCPDRSARSDARRDTQARMNAVLQIRSAPSTSQRYPEQKNCCWIAPRRRGDLLSLGHRRHI